jgi:hypothetical protein
LVKEGGRELLMIKNKSGIGCLLIARQAQDALFTARQAQDDTRAGSAKEATRARGGPAKEATRARSGSFALLERPAAVQELAEVLEKACHACGLHQTDIDSLKKDTKKEVAQDSEAATVTATAAQDSEAAASSTVTATVAHGEAQAPAVGPRRGFKQYKVLPRMDTGIMPEPKPPAAGDQH